MAFIHDFNAIRADFPHAEQRLWLAAAESHPYSIHTLAALDRYAQFRAHGAGEDRYGFTPEMQQEAKQRFATLIHADQDEIAFVQSTTDGENIVLAGLGLTVPGGNVREHHHLKPQGNIVIDDLHFEASKYIYKALEQLGHIELRVVSHRDWQIDLADIKAVIEERTRLVSVALVSQVNGYIADIESISQLAHEHGAYVYADLIQAAGCTSINVQSMGIDFAACNSYKWLMGDFGAGFLFVRAALQGVVRPTRYSLKQVHAVDDFDYQLIPGAAQYEGGGNLSPLSGVCLYEGIKYMSSIGVNAIRSHAKPLTDRLQNELPPLGYTPITPLDSPSPIVSFLPNDVEETQRKLGRAFGYQVVSFRNWYQTGAQGQRERVKGMRLGISVYNNDRDIDQFLMALA
jgi:selenocysteine lyase/cysteine desulfurase